MKKKNKIIPIVITAQPNYRIEQSDPINLKFVWSYEVTVANRGDEIVQLLSRYWRITDTTGKIEEVYGAGVIGLQPIIKPESQFIYTSFCQLATPQGTMEGYYVMQDLDETHFNVQIPRFILSAPSSVMKSLSSIH